MWNDAAVCTMKETVDMYGWYLTRIMSDCCGKKKSSGNQFCEEEIFCSFFCFLLDLNPHSQKYIPQIFFKRTQSQKWIA